jgi:predicted DNA-binding protein YlxM (UPF0122 family)
MADTNPFSQNQSDFQKPSKNSKNEFEERILTDISNSSKRLKILEDRYITIRKKTQLTDQNMLDTAHKFNTEVRAINDEVNKLKILLKEMNEKLNQLISETQTLANRSELITLNKYLDLWKPMHFVTQEQLDAQLNNLRK